MAVDPWLPPYTSTTLALAGSFHLAAAAERSGRGSGGGSMGAPVSTSASGPRAVRYFADSGNDKYTSRAQRLKSRAVRLGSASPVCSTIGIECATAYARVATAAYPPVPTTSAGGSFFTRRPISPHDEV